MTCTVDSSVGLPLCKDICRLCLQDDETLWNIFEAADSDGNNLRLAEKVIACLDIMVVIDDGLPDLICGKCMTVVRSFFEFRKQCQDNDSSLKRCFLSLKNKDLKTEKTAIFNSSQSCPRGVNESKKKQSDEAAFICTDDPNDLQSFSLTLKEKPRVVNAIIDPLLKQLEDEWSDEDPSDIQQINTVEEYPWRLGDISSEVISNSTAVSSGAFSNDWDLDSNDTNSRKKCSTDPFIKTSGQEKETEVLNSESFNSGTVLTNNKFINRSTLVTSDEDVRSEDNASIVPSEETFNLNVTTAVSQEMLAGRVSRNEHGKWVCSTCNKNYTTLRALKKHILVHYSSHFKCTECPATFDSEEKLNIHKTKHFSLSLYLGHSCQHCFKTYRLKHLLEQHLAAEHGLSQNLVTVPKNFGEKCGKCSKVFYSSTEMETHEESCGEGSICFEEESGSEASIEAKSGLKECYLCRLNFENIPQLTYHFKKVHNEELTFKCEICEKLFDTFSHLSDHRSKVHKVKHACQYCQKTFKEKSKLQRHLNSVHNTDRPFKCNLCGNLFKSLDVLKIHRSTHTKLFECVKCGKKFRSKTDLSLHVNVVHLGIKDHMCERCGEKFLSGTRLRYHQANSLSLNLECDVCGKIFCIRQKFQRHVKLHSSTKLHGCNECDLKFLSKKGLCAHVKLDHETS